MTPVLTSHASGVILFSCQFDLNGSDRKPASSPEIYKSCEQPHGDNDLCHYVIVRGDLTVGQQFAQAIHATAESSPVPDPPNTVAVGLRCKNQVELLELDKKLTDTNIAHVLISECDGEPMAIGVIPTRDRKAIRRLTSQLPLVK